MFVINFTKLTNIIIKKLKIGSGYTWPGHLALKLKPKILLKKSIIPKKLIFITGTNGKTTTCKLVTHILRKDGFSVVNNRSGANLLNGIVTELLLDTDFLGRHKSDVGVFEVDEFVLPTLLKSITPDILILTNLSRDQLDRYGEIDTIFDMWVSSLKGVHDCVVMYDSTQDIFSPLISISNINLIPYSDSTYKVRTNVLPGNYNSKNIIAAILACEKLGVSKENSLNYLRTFKPAYGRGEIIKYIGTSFRILLAKNPVSFNINLDLITSEDLKHKDLLFILNDNIPDGRDVSWIYDIDRNKLKQVCENKNVYVSGKRAFDMATRLIYCGISLENLHINKNIFSSIEGLANSRNVLVLPNYSSMLEIRKVLTGKSIL